LDKQAPEPLPKRDGELALGECHSKQTTAFIEKKSRLFELSAELVNFTTLFVLHRY
jgi:hypothetical protein